MFSKSTQTYGARDRDKTMLRNARDAMAPPHTRHAYPRKFRSRHALCRGGRASSAPGVRPSAGRERAVKGGARGGNELTNTLDRHQNGKIMETRGPQARGRMGVERVMGLEPTTSTLARCLAKMA